VQQQRCVVAHTHDATYKRARAAASERRGGRERAQRGHDAMRHDAMSERTRTHAKSEHERTLPRVSAQAHNEQARMP